MEVLRVKKEEINLENFINYYNENIEELLYEYPDYISRICLIDKDYMDVLTCDDDYYDIKNAIDYKELLLDGEYSLLFSVGKTYEGAQKIEIIDGQIYGLSYYVDDIYENENTIKEIGETNINVDNLIGLLFDYEEDENEIVVHLVDFEHGGEISHPRIKKVDNGGDIQELLSKFISRFSE